MKNKIMNSWTGATPGSAAPLVNGNDELTKKLVVMPFGTNASGGATQSIEAILGLNVTEEDGGVFSPISSPNNKCRVYKIHGTYPKDCSMYAGFSAAYPAAGPVAAGTPSIVALTNIPSLPPNPLELDWDVTNAEFQYLFMQLQIGAGSNPFIQNKQPGWAGYPIFRAEFATVEKDYYPVPEGDKSRESYMHAKTEMYVVIDGQMQLFGSNLNQFDVEETMETVDALKGMPAGVVSKDITKVGVSVSGNSYGHGLWLVLNAMQGFYDGSDDWFKKAIQKNEFRELRTFPFYIHVRFQDGRDYWLYIPEGLLTLNGSQSWGSDDFTQLPFMIEAQAGGHYEHWWSRDFIESVDFTASYTLT